MEMKMLSRRKFFGALAAAPVALPLAVEAVAAAPKVVEFEFSEVATSTVAYQRMLDFYSKSFPEEWKLETEIIFNPDGSSTTVRHLPTPL